MRFPEYPRTSIAEQAPRPYMTGPPSSIGREMSEAQRRSVLESNGHGVLSMGVDDRGYGFPISYTFDRDGDRLIMGFADSGENTKREFAERTETVTLTIYEFRDVDSWQSVTVTGTLHETTEPEQHDRPMSIFFLQDLGEANKRRIVDLEEFDRVWYELRIDDISGRHSG